MSQIKATTLSNLAGSKTVPTDTVVDGSAKAWVNFNGTGTVAIRRAFNVSSITDNGTGDYTVNFTNAMADANYAVVGVGDTDRTTRTTGIVGLAGSYTTTSVRVGTFESFGTGAWVDSANISVAIFS